ncbi:enoyl-CoA hydratase/isomerase [Actinoplanes sp. TFC3]|uniref:enoyl-CoA hydratase/isomerase n=1 Tax=Actinoplanes sp. TFC3 TaxID=1710355 RepID=UPI00083288DC|nr:enoyl-CoA hydratase/isomerase [Actinoplanes sp. TFC3]
MDVLTGHDYRSIRVSTDAGICTVRLHRPEAGNTITAELVAECTRAVHAATGRAKVLVIEGTPEVFCLGADFTELGSGTATTGPGTSHAEALYDLWRAIAQGPFVSVAHVRGKVNAGGVGFVAACDVVISDDRATFGLSELLFGLIPACVLPFLIRRIGAAKANYLSVMTQPVTAQQALDWQLVDVCGPDSGTLLRRHLRRLRCLPATGIARYKTYLRELDDSLGAARPAAVAANHAVFSDPANLAGIDRYVRTGRLPWEEESA